jgi:hypothetical protein
VDFRAFVDSALQELSVHLWAMLALNGHWQWLVALSPRRAGTSCCVLFTLAGVWAEGG